MMIMIMSDDNRLKRLRGIGEDIMRQLIMVDIIDDAEVGMEMVEQRLMRGI